MDADMAGAHNIHFQLAVKGPVWQLMVTQLCSCLGLPTRRNFPYCFLPHISTDIYGSWPCHLASKRDEHSFGSRVSLQTNLNCMNTFCHTTSPSLPRPPNKHKSKSFKGDLKHKVLQLKRMYISILI
jgi:hypothetical protein